MASLGGRSSKIRFVLLNQNAQNAQLELVALAGLKLGKSGRKELNFVSIASPKPSKQPKQSAKRPKWDASQLLRRVRLLGRVVG